MKGSMSTDLGIITISPEVIAKYAGTVAVECFFRITIHSMFCNNVSDVSKITDFIATFVR